METETDSQINGRVVEARSKLPLAGITVQWIVTGQPTRERAVEPALLGTAVSDQAGYFRIRVAEDPVAQEEYCRLQLQPRRKTVLQVVGADNQALGKPLVLKDGLDDIILPVPAQRQGVEKPKWAALANYLTTNRMLLVRDLAQQLTTPYADSPARDWSPEQRAAGLRALFNATKTKGERTEAALHLMEQNQFVDTVALASGNLRKAVTHFGDVRVIDSYADQFDKIFPWMLRTDLELYRDYLRGVWVVAAQQMYADEEQFANVSAALFERQLDERFHQDFHTKDERAHPAAKLLVPILLSILTADANREGFGLLPAVIPPQGTSTDAEYLQELIQLCPVSLRELRNRFRISFERGPHEMLNPLQLNVEALLGLLADTYQSPQEPFNARPDVGEEGKPLIFGEYVGRAPFFLQYEEWQNRERTFFPENIYDIRKNIPNFSKTYRESIRSVKDATSAIFPGKGYFDDYPTEKGKSAEWIECMFAIADKLTAATAKIDAQLYPDAQTLLDETYGLLQTAAHKYSPKWVRDRFRFWNETAPDNFVSLIDRAKLPVTSPAELAEFEAFFRDPFYPESQGFRESLAEPRERALAEARTLYIYCALYLAHVLIPYLRASIYFAQGDYVRALYTFSLFTGYGVGVAEPTNVPGYDEQYKQAYPFPHLYQETTLPYTTLVGFDGEGAFQDLPTVFFGWQDRLDHADGRMALAPFEKRFFKLAQGEVMLAWADQLYRNDDPSSIRRARELYKGVLFMHGDDPDIAPHFRQDDVRWYYRFGAVLWRFRDNPAVVSQVQRAHLALYQIEQGLNAYGYRDDMVPVLRYKPLKQAADLFAASAKSAQGDFLDFMTRYEQALIEIWQTQAMVKKAQASAGIADEHIAISQAGVDKAKEQVAAVQAQIVAKQKEIADHDSFWGQAGDFFGGVKDALTGMVPLAKKVMKDESPAGAVTGDQFLTIFEKGAAGGAGAAKDATAATLGSGAAFMIGFGTFVYTSYSSMVSMEEAANKRSTDVKSLQNVALPAAEAQVRLKEREVTIGRYELQIANADLEFARTLFRFQQDRFLNADFWNKLSLFANRLMRRYVELGARVAWQAERALAFEQNRDIHIIRLNYLPAALRGVTGADRLQADLAELEANRLQGVRLTTPVKHTISLVRDYPIAYGQLKKTGRCRFHTLEAELRAAYPGTFGHRIRAITVAALDPDGAPPRGMLRNQGISVVSREDLTSNILIRFPDALALSEFRLHDDLFVYGLPGETLLQFEGSGYETDWELEFPIAANSRGLRSVADVLITFDMNATYSEALAAKAAAAAPTNLTRSVVLAASNVDPKGLQSLKATAGPAGITFDPAQLALPAQETQRSLTNLALICVGQTTQPYQAKLKAVKSAKTASFTIENGLALSNAGPLQGTNPPQPLNALVGLDVNQPFALDINRSDVAEELKHLYDVVLYLEYKAKL